MSLVGRHVRVAGRVQGVFFRAWTQQQARALGITGWVRNCPDGSVEAEITGDEAAVAELIDRLRVGPPAARVDALDSEDMAAGSWTSFAVRR